MAKLRRTPQDRRDFDDEVRQPTCYEARDPARPWLASTAYEDDYDDIELARHLAGRAPLDFPSLGNIAPKEEAPRIVRTKFDAPPAEGLRRAPVSKPRITVAELARLKAQLHANRTAPAPVEPPKSAYPPMRLYVHTMNEIDAFVELLGDPGVLAFVIPLPGKDNQLRLVADSPRWMPTDVLRLVLKHHSHNIVRVEPYDYIQFLHRRRLD